MKSGIGSHHSSKMEKDEWLTPPEIIEKLGCFDMDPCSPVNRPWDTARKHYSIIDDGLSKEWQGTVFMNPPYGKNTAVWMKKLKDHGNGIALIFARTETKMFFDHIWNDATSLLFIEGRLFFYHVNGSKANMNSGAPSVLIAYGQECSKRLENSGIKGKFVKFK